MENNPMTIGEWQAALDAARDEVTNLRERVAILHAILTDPVNQLEKTKGGYYIYRFDQETMGEIAAAIGLTALVLPS